jgi:hypothetical protein
MAEIVLAGAKMSPVANWYPIRIPCVGPVDVMDYLVLTGRGARKVTSDDPVRHLVALSKGVDGELIDAVIEVVSREDSGTIRNVGM